MVSLTINLSDEQFIKLEKKAKDCGLSAKELVEIEIDEIVLETDKEFSSSLDYVLKKNQELYKRLSK